MKKVNCTSLRPIVFLTDPTTDFDQIVDITLESMERVVPKPIMSGM